MGATHAILCNLENSAFQYLGFQWNQESGLSFESHSGRWALACPSSVIKQEENIEN